MRNKNSLESIKGPKHYLKCTNFRVYKFSRISRILAKLKLNTREKFFKSGFAKINTREIFLKRTFAKINTREN